MTFARRMGATLAVVIVAAVALTGCTPTGPATPSIPDPVDVVTAYLNALAEGDSATALALDAIALDYAPFTQSTGIGFLDTDALKNASERIKVGDIKMRQFSDDGEETANAYLTFTLAGEKYTPHLRMRWDKKSESWVLLDSLANLVYVYTFTTGQPHIAQPVPFTLDGATPTSEFNNIDPPLVLAYPGVYRLSVQLDPSQLADQTTQLERDLAVPPYLQAWHVIGFTKSVAIEVK